MKVYLTLSDRKELLIFEIVDAGIKLVHENLKSTILLKNVGSITPWSKLENTLWDNSYDYNILTEEEVFLYML